MNKQTALWIAAPLLLMSSLGHAQSREASPSVNRDTGIGKVIAEQGNAALKEIREDLIRALPDFLQPDLPTPSAAPLAAMSLPVTS